MTDLITRSQLQILAETLSAEVQDIAPLERLGAEELRILAERTSNVIFDDLAAVFSRVSRLAPLVPNALVAKTAQAMIPPLVSGRAAGALGVDHPDRITAVLSRISPEYMADCAPFLDPRTVALLAPKVEARLIIPVANILMERKEYLTASRFVEHATPELVSELESGVHDDQGVLNTAALIPNAKRLSEIVRMLRGPRLDQIVRGSTATLESTLVGLSTLARLDHDIRSELAEMLISSLGSEELGQLVETALANDAGAELLAVVDALSPEVLEPLAGLEALQNSDTVAYLSRVAREADEISAFLKVAEQMPGSIAADAVATLHG